jgi:hypothetical protein
VEFAVSTPKQHLRMPDDSSQLNVLLLLVLLWMHHGRLHR